MRTRIRHLKVNLKSLAYEAKCIRKEERKTRDPQLHQSLHDHRTEHLRSHTRSRHLAYGFLRGHPYKAMENKCYEWPDFDEVKKIVDQFGACEDHSVPWYKSGGGYPRSEDLKQRKSDQDTQWEAWWEDAIAHLGAQNAA